MAFKLLRKSTVLGILLDIDGERTPFSTLQISCYCPSQQAGFILWGQHAESKAIHLLGGFKISVRDAKMPNRIYEWCLDCEIEKILIAALEGGDTRYHPAKVKLKQKDALANFKIQIKKFDIQKGILALGNLENLGLLNSDEYSAFPRTIEAIRKCDDLREIDAEAGAVLFALSQHKPAQEPAQMGTAAVPGFTC